MSVVDFSLADSGAVVKVYDLTTLLTSYANASLWVGSEVGFDAQELGHPSLLGYYVYRRALFSFDTSSLAGQTITKVEFYRSWDSFLSPAQYDVGTGVSRNYEIVYAIGDFGATLDYNQAEYDGGTDCLTESGLGSTFSSAGFVDLGANGIAGINKTGRTTIKIRNTYNDSFPVAPPDNSNGAGYFDVSTTPCYLRVTTQDAVPGCSPLQLMGGS